MTKMLRVFVLCFLGKIPWSLLLGTFVELSSSSSSVTRLAGQAVDSSAGQNAQASIINQQPQHHHHAHKNANHRTLQITDDLVYLNSLNAHQNLLYPFDEHDYMSNINSLKQFHDQPLPFRLPFSGFAYNYIWVSIGRASAFAFDFYFRHFQQIHKDGYVSFNRGLKSYNFPLEFPMTPDNSRLEEDPSMMAIFFAHQDIPSQIEDAGVYFRLVNVATERDVWLRERILKDFDGSMACTVGFEPRFALIITWKNMTFPNRRDREGIKVSVFKKRKWE